MGLPLTKLQHNVCSKIVRSILLMAKYRHTEYVEGCMSDLMQGDPEKLPDCRIGRRHAVWINFIRQGFQYMFQKLVTNGHSGFVIFAPVPRIHLLAFCRLDGELFR